MLLNDLLKSGFIQCDDPIWQDTPPTEPNTMWWFFGYPYGKSQRHPRPELHVVEVWLTGNNHIVYVRSGTFMEKDDKAIGKWKKVEITLPMLD